MFFYRVAIAGVLAVSLITYFPMPLRIIFATAGLGLLFADLYVHLAALKSPSAQIVPVSPPVPKTTKERMALRRQRKKEQPPEDLNPPKLGNVTTGFGV